MNEEWSAPTTVLIDNGAVSGLLLPDAPLPKGVDRVIDADGMLVMPGAVDPHCHVDTLVGEFTTRDDYAMASEAALWGGTTTIIDFAIPVPGQSPLDAVNKRLARVGEANTDVALHGCVIDWSDDMPEQLAAMADLGVRTVKLFTTYRDVLMASPDTVLRVMRHLNDLGGLAYVHAEANHLIEAAQAERETHNEMGARHHAGTRPENTEVASVVEVLGIAETLDAPVYFVHQTTPSAVSAVTDARSRGVRAYSETCPHYLILNSDWYQEPEPERFVCCPPLRSQDSVEGLRAQTFRGEVHTIGSDHNCFDLAQKLEHRGDVRHMPNGLPGVEMRLPVMYSELVHERGLTPTALVSLLAAQPAKLNGIYPRKGTISVGSDADIVIFDPAESRTVTVDTLHMRSDYSPYEGRKVTGWPRTVLKCGEVVVDAGRWQEPRQAGRFLESARFDRKLVV